MASLKPLTDEEMFGASPAIKPLTDAEMFGDLPSGTGNQTSGPVPTKEGLLSLVTPKKENIPELVGTTIGGITGGFPGAMLGGAAGEAYKQLGQRAGILPGTAPETSTDAALSIGGGAARGGLAEGFGRVIGKALSPFSGSVTPAIKTGVQAAERSGIKPPLSAMTESAPVQSLERYAELGPFGGVITARKNAAVRELENFTDRISAGISPDNPPELIADTFTNGAKNFEVAFKKAKDKLYEPINAVLNNKPVNPENTVNAIKAVLERRAGGKEGVSLLENWLERLQPGNSNVVRSGGRYIPSKDAIVKEGIPGLSSPQEIIKESQPGRVFGSGGGSLKAPSDIPSMLVPKELPFFSTLKAIRTEIGSRGNFNDPGVTGIKSDLEYIYSQASKDMDDLATKYGMGDSLDAVNAQYSQGIKKLQGSLIKAINKRADSSPETMYNLIIRKDSPTLIKAGREILGEDGFNQVRKQWFDNLIEKSKSVIEGEEIVSPVKLANNLRRMGSSLEEIASGNPELAQKLADLSDVSKLLTRGSTVTKGSQTAYIRDALIGIRGILAAPLVRTETGREFLTTGFPRLGIAATRIVQPAAELGLQKVSE